MRVFVAGATGAMGTRLVPQLIDRGHEVIGTFRSSSEKAEHLRVLGVETIALDLLDAAAVCKAVLDARPEVIVHEATALAGGGFSRTLDKTFAQTNRLRTEGTDALLTAARKAGVGRFVAQSFAPYRYAMEGGMVKTEDDRSCQLRLGEPKRRSLRWPTSTEWSPPLAGLRCATAVSMATPTTSSSSPCAIG
jgi:2-alkyl-3-oxoalkanoate reductase